MPYDIKRLEQMAKGATKQTAFSMPGSKGVGGYDLEKLWRMTYPWKEDQGAAQPPDPTVRTVQSGSSTTSQSLQPRDVKKAGAGVTPVRTFGDEGGGMITSVEQYNAIQRRVRAEQAEIAAERERKRLEVAAAPKYYTSQREGVTMRLPQAGQGIYTGGTSHVGSPGRLHGGGSRSFAPQTQLETRPYTSQREGVTMQIPQIDQWNADAPMPATQAMLGKAWNTVTNVSLPLKGAYQLGETLLGEPETSFDADAQRQALAGMGNFQSGVERMALGINSIAESPGASLRYTLETAGQAGKNLLENLQNARWREAARKKNTTDAKALIRALDEELSVITVWNAELGKHQEVPAGTNPQDYNAAALALQKKREAIIALAKQADEQLQATTVDRPVNPDSAGSRMMAQVGGQRTAALEGLSPVGQFLGGTAISIGQNAALVPLGMINPALPLAGMGVISGANKAYEVQQNGGGATEALARASVAGLIEVATEKLPLNHLLKIASSPVGKEAIKNILKQMGIEGTEEMISYVGNYFADVAFRDPNAKFSLKEMLLTGLSGGISGFTMSGGATIAGGVTNGTREAQVGAALQANQNVQATDSLVPLRAQESPAFRQGGAKSEKGSGVLPYTPQEVGQIQKTAKSFRNIVEGIDVSIRDFFTKWKTEKPVGSPLEKLYLGKISDSLAQQLSAAFGYPVQSTDFILTNDDVRHIFEHHGDTGAEIARGNIPITEENIHRLMEVLEQPDRVYPGEIQWDGRQSAKIEKSFPDGTAFCIEVDNSGRGTLQTRTFYIQKKKSTTSAGYTETTAQPHTSETSDPVLFNSIISQSAEGVKNIMPHSTAENTQKTRIRSTDPIVQGMFEAQDRIQATRRTQRVMDTLGKKLGVQIVIDPAGGKVNGFYDGETRTIHISPNATDPLGVVLSHEVIHRLKETSPVQYAELERLALQQLQHANALDSLVTQVRAAYGNGSQEMILDEVVARYMQNLVTNINEFERLVGINRNLAQKLLDWLDEFLHQARLSLRGLSAKEQKEVFFGLTLDEVEATRKAWAEAVRRADAGAVGSGVRYHISDTAEAAIEEVLQGKQLRTQVRLRDFTPASLVERGIPDLPMYMNATHIRENILSEDEARAKGLPVDPRIHYHGLGKELFLGAVDAMDGAIEVFQWKKNPYNQYGLSDYLVITQVVDQSGNKVVVPIVINSTANANNAYIDVNEIKSIYGKSDLNQYLSQYTGRQALVRVKGKKPQSANAGEYTSGIPQKSASFSSILPQVGNTVNSDSSPNFQTPSPTHTEQLPTQMERDAEAAVRLGQASQAMQERKKKELEHAAELQNAEQKNDSSLDNMIGIRGKRAREVVEWAYNRLQKNHQLLTWWTHTL